MLVSGRELLQDAVSRGVAVGSFNTYNLEIARAIVAAAEAAQALIVRLTHKDDAHVQSWRVVTDLDAPVGSESGPAPSAMACNIQAATRLPNWLSTHMPGWQIREWVCLPVDEVAAFLAAHGTADI